MATNIQSNYKVKLIAVSSLLTGISSNAASYVTFEVTPTFSESGDVNYDPIQPIHMPGGMQVYKSTPSRRFSIGATLISRTSDEATQNMRYLQTLRGWRMPYFGSSSTITDPNQKLARTKLITNSTTNTNAATRLTPEQRAQAAVQRAQTEGIELLGAPPDVLYLYAYSTNLNDSRNIYFGVNINRVPVVLTSLVITYPTDVDYLPIYANDDPLGNSTGPTSEPFPMKMDVQISLAETHSPREYENFNLTLFKQGKMTGF